MNTDLPEPVIEQLKDPFERLLSTENFGDTVNDIAELVSQGKLTAKTLEEVLQSHSYTNMEKIKDHILDMILSYINLILSDSLVTPKEAGNVKFLKRFFKINEGDFYSRKFYEIEAILDKQLARMYQDNIIDNEEALQKVELQSLFDLSYDQFLLISQKAVKSAIDRGADPTDLDTFLRSS